MRRGFLLSLLLHLMLILGFALNLPELLIPEEKVTYINVKLVASANAAKTSKPKEVKKVRTQQSAAPREAPKAKPQQNQKAEKTTHLVQDAKSDVKKQVKEQKKQQTAAESQKTESRPPKLDKTRDRKNIVAEKAPPTEDNKPEDQFLAALDFIDDIKDKESALAQDDNATETTIYDVTQQDVATLKKHIERNWYRTPGIANLNEMAVVVRVKVNRDGSISSLDVVQSSGKAFFDNSLLRAVRKSVPLPIPADKYDIFKTIELRFNG